MLEQNPSWFLLDMIFVTPAGHRRGLGSALAAAVLSSLDALGGYRTLVSRYHLGNEASRAWHHHFGFREEPDLRFWDCAMVLPGLTWRKFMMAQPSRAAVQELIVQHDFGALIRDGNSGPPTDLSQLKPYLDATADDVVLRRYVLLPTTNLVPELQLPGDWVLTQNTPVNKELDTRNAMNLTGGRVAGRNITNRWDLPH